MNFFAEAGTATNAQIGTWVIILFAVINGAIGIVSIFSLFATRREVDRIDARVTKLEDVDVEIRAEVHLMKDELISNGEKRSTSLHRRIDPMIETLAAVKAGQETFTKSFDNFTEVMKSMVSGQSTHKVYPARSDK